MHQGRVAVLTILTFTNHGLQSDISGNYGGQRCPMITFNTDDGSTTMSDTKSTRAKEINQVRTPEYVSLTEASCRISTFTMFSRGCNYCQNHNGIDRLVSVLNLIKYHFLFRLACIFHG